MKKILSLLLLLLILPVSSSQAQSTAPAIESLTLDLWPDYDRAAVLVLLTGTLPDETSLPTTLTIPLPEAADFNVAARIDASDGRMKDDIDFELGQGEVTFTTPDLRFRVEYYFPYTGSGNQRSFTFTWLADVRVNELLVSIQEPTAASNLLTEPASVDVMAGNDGFFYHTLPPQIVPAGQPFSVRVDYTMTSSELSAQRSSPSIADASTTGFSTPERSSPASEIDWPAIAVAAIGLVAIVAVTWQIATARATTSRRRKPRPQRGTKEQTSATPNYCHICGQPVQAGDKFCRECGSPVKGT